MQEREINLIDLMVEILLKWRTIVVLMLVGAVLLGAFSFAQSWRDSNAQANQVAEAQSLLEQLQTEHEMNKSDVMNEEISKFLQWLEDQLTEQQVSNVEYTLVSEELFKKRKTYKDQSVIMQMDPDNVYRASLTFYVSSESKEQSYSIENIYEDLIRSAGMSQYIADQIGIPVFGATEIVSLLSEFAAQPEGQDSFTVEAIYYNEQGCHDIIQAIQDYINLKYDEMAEIVGEYAITALEPSFSMSSNTTVLNVQRNYWNDVISLQNTITRYKDSFSSEEWIYYDILLNGEITELSAEKVEEVVSEANEKDSQQAQSETDEAGLLQQIQDEEELLAIIEQGVTVTPRISIRYVALGAIGAAFIYVFVIFVIYILNTKLQATDNLKNIYGIPQLGLISDQKEIKKPFGFVDKWILSIRNHGKRTFTKDEAMKLATLTVKMSAEREALDTVYLVGCDLKESTMAICGQIKEALQASNIQVDILSNVLYDAEAMGKLDGAKGVVLVEKAQSTLYDEICQELNLLKRQGVNVLGGIIVE